MERLPFGGTFMSIFTRLDVLKSEQEAPVPKVCETLLSLTFRISTGP